MGTTLSPVVGDPLREAKGAAEEDLLFSGMSFALSAESGSEGFGYENIVGVGISSQVETDPAVAVYVVRKAPPDLVEDRALVPPAYEGVPTTVVESGEFISLSGRGRQRPVPLGTSIGHLEGQTGTLGFLASRDGDLFVVSNNHVLARENQAQKGDLILQPGRYDGGSSEDRFAELTEWTPLDFNSGRNRVDAAIARTDPSVVSGQLLDGGPVGTALAGVVLNLPVRKCGRTTGVTKGLVTDVSATIKLKYPSGQVLLEDQLLIRTGDGSPFSAEGDSGSLIIDDASNQPLGLLCGGSPVFTVATKLEMVLEELGVSWAG